MPGYITHLGQYMFDALKKLAALLKGLPIIGFFMERSFFHYLWIGGAYSVLNIFLLWLLIDNFKIPTVISSTIVIGGTFILRYIVFRLFKVV